MVREFLQDHVELSGKLQSFPSTPKLRTQRLCSYTDAEACMQHFSRWCKTFNHFHRFCSSPSVSRSIAAPYRSSPPDIRGLGRRGRDASSTCNIHPVSDSPLTTYFLVDIECRSTGFLRLRLRGEGRQAASGHAKLQEAVHRQRLYVCK
jgi:hypothetical protein